MDIEMKERDEQIFWDRIMEIKTCKQLAAEHDISRTRITQIVERQRRIFQAKHKQADAIKIMLTQAAEYHKRISHLLQESAEEIQNMAGAIKMESCHWGVRTYHCLKNLGIVYLKDLENFSAAELLRTPNFGRKSLNEVIQEMDRYGFFLKNGSAS